ncbi:MAG: hypothetical protein ACHQK8_05390 [Bacteroidia bacterium]
MKTKIILLSIIAVLGLAVLFAFSSNEKISNAKEIILVRIIESKSGFLHTPDPRILIISDKVTEIKLEDNKDKYLNENSVTIHKTIKELLDKNYKIISSTSKPAGIGFITDYLFEKE